MKKIITLSLLSMILFSGCAVKWPWPFDGGHGGKGSHQKHSSKR